MTCLALLAVASLVLSASDETGILEGHWYTEDNESIVEIRREEESGKFFGRIVWLAEPLLTEADAVEADAIGQPKRDLNNPDPKRHEVPIIGLEILTGFTARDTLRWDGGTVYDPNNGKTYKCTLRLDRDGRLVVRGYALVPALGRSTLWVRAPATKDEWGA